MRHVLFKSGEQRWALPLTVIREVVLPPAKWTAVPRAPPCVLGVFNLRGRVVLGVGLASLLDEKTPKEKPQRVLLLDKGRRDVGLCVDAVLGIESIASWESQLESAHSAHKGAARLHGADVMLLDDERVEKLLNQAFEG
jgi:purine-binding chemotaxis protein CheW